MPVDNVARMNRNSPYRYAIGGMIGMAAAMGIGRFVYTPILPGMMTGLGLSASDAGLIASANFLGYLLGAIAAAGGWAEGRERPMMLLGLGSSALFAALMALTDDVLAFVVIRFLAGWASAFMMIFLSMIVFPRLLAAGRNDLQSVHFGGVGLGIAVSSLMTGALAMMDVGWRAGWIGAAAISAVGFVATYLLVDKGPEPSGPVTPEPALPKSRALSKIILAYGMFGFGYIVTATFLVAIVRQGGADPLFESAVWLVTGLAAWPSVFLWGRFARRYGLIAAVVAGCLVEAVGVVASVSLGGYLGPMIGAVLLGGTFVAVTAYGLQAGRQLAEKALRRTFALMTAAFGTGQILGPIFAGYMADWTGSFFLPSLGAALMLLGCAVLTWNAGRDQQRDVS